MMWDMWTAEKQIRCDIWNAPNALFKRSGAKNESLYYGINIMGDK